MATDLLAGVRVLEIGELVAAPYAGRLLASLGADVLKVEKPEGDVLRQYGPFRDGNEDAPGGLFAYLNAGKRNVVLNPDDRSVLKNLHDLTTGSDILLIGEPEQESARWSLDLSELRAKSPSLIVVKVAILGENFDASTQTACDLDACALAAVSWVIGEPDREPLSLPFWLADYQAGVHAAAAAVAALLGVVYGGAGQEIEVAAADVLASYSGTNAMIYEPYDLPWARAGRRASGSGGPYPYGIFRCRDGFVCLIARSKQDWDRFLDAIGPPSWAADARYHDQLAMGRDYPDEVDSLLAPLLEQRTKLELVALSQTHGFPLAPVLTINEVLNHPHMVARSNFQTMAGSPDGARFPAPPFRINGVAPSPLPPPPLLATEGTQSWGPNR